LNSFHLFLVYYFIIHIIHSTSNENDFFSSSFPFGQT